MEIAQRVESEIKRYLADPNPQQPYLLGFVEHHQVLPLLVDWNGFFGLRPNGDILLILHDDRPVEVELVEDSRIRRIALSQGTKKYAWVGELIPSRPSDAVACSGCGGSGQIIIGGIVTEIICYCGGLGWLEAVEQEAVQNMQEKLA